MKHFRLPMSILILVAIDLVSKYFFYNLKYLEDTSLIRPTLNTGISRSLPVPFIVIILISMIGIGVFVWLFVSKKLGRIASALLIAGTLGNFIDRIVYAGVRDFINIGVRNFPIFNIADILLSIGVGLRIVQVILEKRK